jgi:predicted transcriptional regulator
MTITLPADLERDLTQWAEQLGVAPDEVVRRAVARILYIEPELQAELDFWQQLSWQAWSTVVESLK